MGLHAFAEEPEHCALYRAIDPAPPPLVGCREGWNMPTARHRRAFGGEASFPGVGHFIVTLHVAGAVARLMPPGAPEVLARRGAVSLQPPGDSLRLASDGAVEYAHFYFQPSLLSEVAEEAGTTTTVETDGFYGRCAPSLEADLVQYLARTASVEERPSGLEMDTRSYVIGLMILRAGRTRPGGSLVSVGRLSRREVAAVVEFIESRLAEPLRLSELAALAGMSPFHFARVFRRETGMTPARWVMRRRTERAVEMIRTTRDSLADIAFRTGFSSQSHMTRNVRDLTGQTPTALRDHHTAVS